MKSLKTKIILVYTLITIFLVSLIMIFTYQTTKENYTELITQNLKNLNTSFIFQIKPILISNNIDSLRLITNSLGKKVDARLTIIDTDGVVLADSKFDPNKMENHYQRKEIKEVLLSIHETSIIRHSATLDKDMLYLAMPIIVNKKIIGVSRVSMFIQDLEELTNKIIKDIIKLSVIFIIIATLIIIIISNNITKPLKQLAIASRKIALGDFENKISIKTNDEIKELGTYFNEMTDKLSKIFDELKHQKETYTTLIASIEEGLFVVSLTGEILIVNKAFKKILKISFEPNIHYDKLIKNDELIELIENSINTMKPQRKEILINSSYYLCTSNPIETKNEILFIIYNINDIKNLDQIKKDFIVNVSHELRTPLTSIKGFIEALEENSTEENKKYIDIINRNTDRLSNIVQDLLMLSELEDNNNRMHFSKTDIRILCDNVYKLLEQKAQKKGLKLIIQIEVGFPKIIIDPFKIEQVFINLLDNAIKYTDNGFVKLYIYQRKHKAMIEVTDSGIGITKEHHERVFERFYTVDKSRSRKVGGTGLGLSIVKHIVLLHSGEIWLDASYTSGTKFIIEIPLKN